MDNSTQDIYKKHHSENRPENFSVMEKERGDLLQKTIGTNKKVLDIGCRDGVLTRHFSSGNEVLGVDIDEGALNKAQSNLGIQTLFVDLNGDWHELNGKKFDVIVAGEVMEHLYFPQKITEQAFARLNKGGVFLGSVPNAFTLKHRLRYLMGSKKHTPLSDPTHINQFSVRDLRDVLTKNFKEVEIMGLGRYGRLAKTFPSLFGFDLFFVCRN